MKTLDTKRSMVDLNYDLSISEQCRLLSLNRSTLYYTPKPESPLNLELMRLMDEHYLNYPDKSARRMHVWLTKDKGYNVSLNRINRLYYNVMGLQSVLPGPHTSKRAKGHKIYPYLLRGLEINHPNQVWATDITYIPMAKGYLYLVAIIDLYSRFVVGWSLSNTMEAQWCADCFLEAIRIQGCPEILNTDQGSQFTCELFSTSVTGNDVLLSMDGKGRATDNAFIERLWRSVKYEKIYLNPPTDGLNLYKQLADYFRYYNTERRHSSIGDNFPIQYYHNALNKNSNESYPQKNVDSKRKKKVAKKKEN